MQRETGLMTGKNDVSCIPTYDVESEVAITADVSGCIFGAAVVKSVVVWTGTFEG